MHHVGLQQGGGLLPEVEAFDDFHEQHGPTGSWHPDDHSEFERILKTCKGDYSHATLMCYDHMIGFKRADIIAHARLASAPLPLPLRSLLTFCRSSPFISALFKRMLGSTMSI